MRDEPIDPRARIVVIGAGQAGFTACPVGSRRTCSTSPMMSAPPRGFPASVLDGLIVHVPERQSWRPDVCNLIRESRMLRVS